MTARQRSWHSTKSLQRQVTELNRIETAVLSAARTCASPPTSAMVFGALSDASHAFADVIDAHAVGPMPADVRTGLLQLNCCVTDLVISLKLYTSLEPAPKAARQQLLSAHPMLRGICPSGVC